MILKKRNEEIKPIFLTFDDGPHPEISPFILNALDKFNQKATFFYLGFNLEKNLKFKYFVLEKNHLIANHGYFHLNGWTTNCNDYFLNALKFNRICKTDFFRPPYGKISLKQWWLLKKIFKIVFWNYMVLDVFTLDINKIFFDLINHTYKFSIIVFHENEKTIKTLPLYFENYLYWLVENNFQSFTLNSFDVFNKKLFSF